MQLLKYLKDSFNLKLINGGQSDPARVLSCRTSTSTQLILRPTLALPSMKLWISRRTPLSLRLSRKKAQTRVRRTRRIVNINKKVIRMQNSNQEALKIIGVVVVAEAGSSQLQMKLNSDSI